VDFCYWHVSVLVRFGISSARDVSWRIGLCRFADFCGAGCVLGHECARRQGRACWLSADSFTNGVEAKHRRAACAIVSGGVRCGVRCRISHIATRRSEVQSIAETPGFTDYGAIR